ncbi:hypothetical protein F2Q68_00017486 [Brassica cretica]|uniref:DUF4283 domain-containing protein n=1 Tax=Brassica cretica TaxID=69181 RepID=A0A8S9HGC9_BRACR|nr:hypothetical protein F2Q68_00017486 [Brassica cretica]
MANPWFPSGSASAFSLPLDTAGDSRPSCPFQDPLFPPLSSSKPTHLSLRTAYLGPVDKTSASAFPPSAAPSTAQAPEPVASVTDSRTTVPGSRSGNTVAHPPVSKNLIQNPPTPPSPTLTAATTSSSPPLILDTPLNPNAFTPPTLNSAPPYKAASNTNNTQTNKPARPQPPLVERLRLSNDKSLSRLAPVSISDTGRPRVLIPDSVFLKGAKMHKYFIVCHFNGRPPPFSQIQSVLNNMWGKR